MTDTLDLNIDNYTIDDLYDIFSLSKNAGTEEVVSVADEVISKQNTGEVRYFLEKARDKIVEYQSDKLALNEFDEDTDQQLKTWWENQYLMSGNKVQSDKVTSRRDKIEIFDDKDGHFQMKQNVLGVNQTYQLPYAQGTINPNLKNQVERLIVLDSQYRTNIFPYAGTDITKPSFNTDFTFTLSESLNNVTEIELDSVHIPRSWYNFDTFFGNICFRVITGSLDIIISIDSGNYSETGLKTEINDKLSAAGITNLTIDYSQTKNKFSFTDISGSSQLIFYQEDGFIGNDVCQQCQTTMYANNSLGWCLGWRITPDSQNNNIVKLTIDTTDTYYADAGPKMEPVSYFIIVIDDFNKNRLNTGIISSVDVNNKLDLPSYTNANNLACDTSNNEIIFSKVAPRKLTQAQLYTINRIYKDRQISKFRNSSPTTSDAFCIIPVFRQNNTADIVFMSNQVGRFNRQYFGPVTIERLRARLLDDKGNLINLNGRDWGLAIRAKQLYQY